MDVVLLPEMILKLKPQLEALGRWSWLQEDVARMQRTALTPADPDLAYLRFSGIGRMDQGTLQALKYLARWREAMADEKNRARGFVIPDSAMLQLARAKPATSAELKAIAGIHPAALGRYEDMLLGLIADAARDPAPVEKLEQLDEQQRQKLNKMRGIVESRAAELGVEAALLASRRELEKLIRAVAADEPLPERFLGWRKEVITDQLIAVA
jgi:ribonuclease D